MKVYLNVNELRHLARNCHSRLKKKNQEIFTLFLHERNCKYVNTNRLKANDKMTKYHENTENNLIMLKSENTRIQGQALPEIRVGAIS